MIKINIKVITNYGFSRLRLLNFFLIPLLMAIFLKPDVGWGQGECPNIITNGDFEIYCAPSNSFNMIGCTPGGWRAATGTPDCDLSSSLPPNSAQGFGWLSLGNNSTYILESVYLSTANLKPTATYNLSFDYYFHLSRDGDITNFGPRVYATDIFAGLSNAVPSIYTNQALFNGLNAVSPLRLLNSNENDTWINVQSTFTVANFTPQLWFSTQPRANLTAPYFQDFEAAYDNITLNCVSDEIVGISYTSLDKKLNFSPTYLSNFSGSDMSTFDWSFGDPNSGANNTSNLESPIHVFSDSGEYEVCLSFEDNDGCCNTVCEMVKVDLKCTCEPPGAQNYTHLYAESGTNISEFFPNANSVIGGKFIVCGNLIIDKNFTFDNCDIRMDPSAEITKNENIDFKLISNTQIIGCNQMWKGINVLGRGRFLMDNALLRNAEYAIMVNNSSNLNLTNSRFENNYVSIYGAPSTNNKVVTVESFYGNVFHTIPNPLTWLPAYTGQVGYLNQETFAGVYVHNTTINISATVTAPNEFKGTAIRNGIVASSSRITSKRNSFNIPAFPTAINVDGTFPVNQIELESLKGSAVFASNCPNVEVSNNSIIAKRGVVVARSNSALIQINSNNISGGGLNGIWIYNASNQSIVIKNNNPIQNFRTGISLNMISAAQDIQIDNNKILNDVPITTGIDLQTVDGARLYSVRNNVVTSISLGSLIRMNLTKRFLVENNVTSNSLASFSVNGFSLTSNSRNQFRNNSFTGTTPNSQIGFITTGSDNDLYCCNTANAAGVGFNFQGMNSIVNRYKQNKMYNNGTGLVLPGGASIGTQTHMGNTWRNLVVGGVTRAINSSDPDASQFFVNFGQMDPAGGVLKPSIVTPSSWFADLSGNALNCGDNPDCGVRIYLIPDIKVPDTVIVDPGGGAISTDPDKLNDMIATTQGDVLNNDYFGQNLWKAQYDLLNELIDMPAYLSVEPILANFYNQNVNSDLRKVVDFDRNERQISKLTPSERILWLAMQDSLNWYTDTVNVIVSTDTSLTNTPLIDFYRNRISHLSADLSSLIGTVNTRAIGNINTLLTAVNAFQPTQAWVQKKKYLMVKRLEYMLNGKNSISPTNYTAITELANSCYLENGVVVHEAQSFLDLYHGYPTEWADSCATATSPRSTSTKVMDIKVFPNPTSNSITIATPTSVEGEFEIYDSQGHSLVKILIVPQNDRYTIDVSQWSNGIYVVKSMINSGPTVTHKFVKI